MPFTIHLTLQMVPVPTGDNPNLATNHRATVLITRGEEGKWGLAASKLFFKGGEDCPYRIVHDIFGRHELHITLDALEDTGTCIYFLL
jgi:hypothetical protein